MKLKQTAEKYLPIPHWPESDRPDQKLTNAGAAALSDSELLAILIRSGTRLYSALDIARRLLRHHGALQDLASMEMPELQLTPGIGPRKAGVIVAAFELGRRVASFPFAPRLKISDPEIVFRHYAPLLGHLRKEMFLVLALNSANVLNKEIRVSEGILNASLVHPREIFRAAVLSSAASIILLHNHPSGEVHPSAEDKSITSRLVEVGKLMDIPVLDHVIIGQGQYFSFREAGLIGD